MENHKSKDCNPHDLRNAYDTENSVGGLTTVASYTAYDFPPSFHIGNEHYSNNNNNDFIAKDLNSTITTTCAFANNSIPVLVNNGYSNMYLNHQTVFQHDQNVTHNDTSLNLNNQQTSKSNNGIEEARLPINEECFGYIENVIVNRVNDIVNKVEEHEIREESPEYEIYESKSDTEDDSKYPNGFITIDECESDSFSIASEEDINELYEKDWNEKDEVKESVDEDVLALHPDEADGYTSDHEETITVNAVSEPDLNIVEFVNPQITGKRKASPEKEEENSPKKLRLPDNTVDDDELFEEPTDIKVTFSNGPYIVLDEADGSYSNDESFSQGASFENFPSRSPQATTSFSNLQVTIKNKKFIPREEVEFVSQDPQENEDNYNQEWQKLKQQIGNEEERYKAIRNRWRNLSVPNPNINLTYRHVNNPGLNSNGKKEVKKKDPAVKNHQRTRSCTSFYESIISNLNMKLDTERQKVLDKHNVDIHRTQMMLDNELNAAVCAAQNPRNVNAQQKLRLTKYRHEQTLQQLKNCCKSSLEQLEQEHLEQVELYQQYMEEVRAFNTFYQGLAVQGDNLQLTEEQYEHLAETERMYMVFKDFYSP